MFLIASTVTIPAPPIILFFHSPLQWHEGNLCEWLVGEVGTAVGVEILGLYTWEPQMRSAGSLTKALNQYARGYKRFSGTLPHWHAACKHMNGL